MLNVRACTLGNVCVYVCALCRMVGGGDLFYVTTYFIFRSSIVQSMYWKCIELCHDEKQLYFQNWFVLIRDQ